MRRGVASARIWGAKKHPLETEQFVETAAVKT